MAKQRAGGVLVAVLGAAVITVCAAQSREQPRPPDGGTREVLISILIPSIPNAPFSATVITHTTRQFADGTTVTQGNHRAIARDRAGRIFQERRMLVPEDGKHESILTQIEISDPVAHELYICVPQENACQVETFSAPAFSPPAAASSANSSHTVEDLGRQTLGGLETAGRRETTVIESGAIGNDQPMLVRREFWYSPQLAVNVVSKVQDPRSGTQEFEMSDIVLGDPDAKLFKIPKNATLYDLRSPAKSPSSKNPSPN